MPTSTPSSPPQIQQALEDPLENGYEVDEFEFIFSSIEKPHMKNDTVTLNRKYARDQEVGQGGEAGEFSNCQCKKLSLSR